MESISIKTNEYPVRDVLPLFLVDKTAKENIIFATESYDDRGELYGAKLPITQGLISRDGGCVIQPRVLKDREEQLFRTRKRAEVFTPSLVCCLMNDHLDEDWFGRKDVFGILEGQHGSLQLKRSNFRRAESGRHTSIQGGWRSPAEKAKPERLFIPPLVNIVF